MRKFINELGLIIGIEQNVTGHLEKWLSGLGGFASIYLCYFVSHLFVKDSAALLLVTSTGASAVLIFAVPHGALSQPWPVIGGHLISACIGVFCQQHIPNTHIAAASAVGLSIMAMYYLRCLHPPGGATALFAVVGGSSIFSLAYRYAAFPVMLNVLSLVFCGVLFNALFRWRRYPSYWFHHQYAKEYTTAKLNSSDIATAISQEDFAAALQQMNSFIDVTPGDLNDLFERAVHSARHRNKRL
ncbi:HPP family protein [Zhongshania sp. BJYM1]|uniref:HPP family protein n=1 Tax=Zhongshania aquatica TaxID=2965069 RepID=UPI0022B32CE8|nr:HPP family protein [Marortus sp. BJYM1]